MAQKPSIPKGTRDFSPAEMMRRTYIFDTIKSVFRSYGFAPLETPAMENLSTLLGKYGDEGDKLLFRILNSGDFLSDYDEEQRKYIEEIFKLKNKFFLEFSNVDNQKDKEQLLLDYIASEDFFKIIERKLILKGFITKISMDGDDGCEFNIDRNQLDEVVKENVEKTIDELIKKRTADIVGVEKGLRYDLTVPFARYVVQHQSEIAFPFKRYQVQPVWRADRPQKGRYREFYQCDVDVIGSRSLLNEVELIQIVERVFKRLKINVTLKMNNRKILFGIAESIGHADKMMDITVAIDKLEKIGIDNVKAELIERGLEQEAIDKLQPILELSGSNSEKLSKLRDVIGSSETGVKGIEEMTEIFSYAESLGVDLPIELDLSLARGLNYYTGAIFEVKAMDYAIGSICGGGRYDDLTGIFGLPNTSGVGISFGADRIYDVMVGLELFPEEVNFTTKVLFVNLGAEEQLASLNIIKGLRDAGIAAEIYPESAKMKKQMEYANRRMIPYVVIIGSNELQERKATVKNMRTGEQCGVDFDAVVEYLK